MEIFGIGPSELFFIIVLILILLGPKDMQRAGYTLGKWLRRIVTSDGWKVVQRTSREIQTLPHRLMREAALDELKELQKIQEDVNRSMNALPREWIQPPSGTAADQTPWSESPPDHASAEDENEDAPSPG